MKKLCYLASFLAIIAGLTISLSAQTSGVPDRDRDAFLRGQMDAQQAQGVGDSLAAYCAGWASIMSTPYVHARNPPVECEQFWTYVDVYGPMFWYPSVYPRVSIMFGTQYGRYRTYGWIREGHDHGRYVKPPYHSRGGRSAVPRPRRHR